MPQQPSSSSAPLSALHAAFVSDHAILEQLLYRNKNQHRLANYYRKLIEVARHNRHCDILSAHQALLASPSSPSSPLPSAVLDTVSHLRCSLRAILRAADPLYALLQMTYHMPFALTSLAVLARLLAVIKAALLALLTQLKDAEGEAEAAEGRRMTDALFAGNSVGNRLLSALRERAGEKVVAAMDGLALQERWLDEPEPLTAEPSTEQAETQAELQHIPLMEEDDETVSRFTASLLQPPAVSAVLQVRKEAGELQHASGDEEEDSDVASMSPAESARVLAAESKQRPRQLHRRRVRRMGMKLQLPTEVRRRRTVQLLTHRSRAARLGGQRSRTARKMAMELRNAAGGG